jgi:HD-GYP domain-containing protein (c-di-GMP phosphodiesterase class II)
MSSDPRSGAPSSETEREDALGGARDSAGSTARGFDLSLATLVQARGSTLLDALELHVPGSRDHADGTASYAFAAAVELGFRRAHAEAVRETARLHEVGKIYVPPAVLAPDPSALDPGDQALLVSYPARGAELARGAGIPEEACAWIAAMGERFDGGGPAGLAGERIPLESRIARVACACDAALNAAPGAGSPPGPHRTALAQLRAQAGQELDPRVIEALSAMLDRAAGRA